MYNQEESTKFFFNGEEEIKTLLEKATPDDFSKEHLFTLPEWNVEHESPNFLVKKRKMSFLGVMPNTSSK